MPQSNGSPFTTGFRDGTISGVDMGNLFIEKDYLIETYPSIDCRLKSTVLSIQGRNGQQGNIGDNNVIVGTYSSPIQTVATGSFWTQVTMNQYRTGGVKVDGTLWMWGRGICGELGDNNTLQKSSPVQTVSTGTNWKQVSAGCPVGAVKTDGTLWMWGRNHVGQLGNNDTLNRSSPVQTVSTGTNWRQVSVGSNIVGAVKRDGTLWMWGCGFSGIFGDNNTFGRFSSPVQTVATGTNWCLVSVGMNTGSGTSNQAGGIKTDGTLWLWGLGLYGLGNNDTFNRSSPVQTVATGTNWKKFAAGKYMGMGLKTDGTLWLWGSCVGGMLGDNGTVHRSSPVQTVATGTNWRSIPSNIAGAGGYINAAIKTDGTLWTWGGTCVGSANLSSPVQFAGSSRGWKSIEVGNDLVMQVGIRDDGGVL